MGPKVSPVVMAHPRRRRFVEELLTKLDRTAEVVWDRRGDRWDTGRRAWLAVDRTADFGLVLQDDVIPCLDLVAGIEKALAHLPKPDVSPLCLYIGRVRPYRDAVNQLVAATNGNTSWITMSQLHWGVGIVIPTHMIDDMVSSCDQRGEIPNYDRRISRWCQHRGLTVWYPWPSLVDHRGVRENPSLMPGRTGDRRAHSFIGEDASAFGQRWDGQVLNMAEVADQQRNSPAPIVARTPKSQRLGVKMEFVSPKHPQLLVHPARIRFRNGSASTDDPAAIKVLLSPKVAALGVQPVGEPPAGAAAETDEQAANASEAPPPASEPEPVGDGEQAADTIAAPDRPDQQPPADEPLAPGGGAKEVLTWVGEDAGRARQALDAEQQREKPRSTLVAALTKLAG